jgi:hypothetical protein
MLSALSLDQDLTQQQNMLPLLPLLLLLLLLQLAPSGSDFTYAQFNDTSALAFNGDVATSSCSDGGPYLYTPTEGALPHGANDASDSGSGAPLVISEDSVARRYGSVATAENISAASGLSAARGASASSVSSSSSAAAAAGSSSSSSGSIFPQRDAYGSAPLLNSSGGCPVRLRLTPSRPFKVGSALRLEPVPVLGGAGWESGFTFQATDPARSCSTARDAAFGTASFKACSVAGGDGLAFLLHGDRAARAGALGRGGSGLGYAGIRSALVLELDSWYNADGGLQEEQRSGDPPFDHAAVQASAAGSGSELGSAVPAVSSGSVSRISGPPLRVNIADGLLHTVRIAYYSSLRLDFLQRFVASSSLTAFLASSGSEAGQSSGIGTLAVWIDEALPPPLNSSSGSVGSAGQRAGGSPALAQALEALPQAQQLLPTFALPLNLAKVLRLPDLEAWVGFTAATGSTSWQKHDILSWYWCNAPGCPQQSSAQQEELLLYNSSGPQLITEAW